MKASIAKYTTQIEQLLAENMEKDNQIFELTEISVDTNPADVHIVSFDDSQDVLLYAKEIELDNKEAEIQTLAQQVESQRRLIDTQAAQINRGKQEHEAITMVNRNFHQNNASMLSNIKVKDDELDLLRQENKRLKEEIQGRVESQ